MPLFLITQINGCNPFSKEAELYFINTVLSGARMVLLMFWTWLLMQNL